MIIIIIIIMLIIILNGQPIHTGGNNQIINGIHFYMHFREKIGLAFSRKNWDAFSRKKWDAFSRKRVDEEFQYFLMLAKPCI